MRTPLLLATAVIAAAFVATAATDAQAQRGWCGNMGSPGCFNPATGHTGFRGRAEKFGYVGVGVTTCSGHYVACVRRYTWRGNATLGEQNCGAARAVCLRTGVWDTRRYGPHGRHFASVERR